MNDQSVESAVQTSGLAIPEDQTKAAIAQLLDRLCAEQEDLADKAGDIDGPGANFAFMQGSGWVIEAVAAAIGHQLEP